MNEDTINPQSEYPHYGPTNLAHTAVHPQFLPQMALPHTLFILPGVLVDKGPATEATSMGNQGSLLLRSTNPVGTGQGHVHRQQLCTYGVLIWRKVQKKCRSPPGGAAKGCTEGDI